MTILGYARVSTDDQTLDLQYDALNKYGCIKIFEDTASGSRTERVGLRDLINYSRPGDTIAVWRLDRLGRSLKHLIELVEGFKNDGIGFISLTENIDTNTSGGQLVFHIFGAIAEFERNIIRERTNAGLTAARARGRTGGRPRRVSKAKAKAIYDMYKSQKYTLKQICEAHGITKPTIYHYVAEIEKKATYVSN